jgi:hypothetical protein
LSYGWERGRRPLSSPGSHDEENALYLPLILLALAVLPGNATPSDQTTVTVSAETDGISGGGPWTETPPPSP